MSRRLGTRHFAGKTCLAGDILLQIQVNIDRGVGDWEFICHARRVVYYYEHSCTACPGSLLPSVSLHIHSFIAVSPTYTKYNILLTAQEV